MLITIFSQAKRTIINNVLFFEYLAKDRTLILRLEDNLTENNEDTVLEPGDLVSVYLGDVCLDCFTVAQPVPFDATAKHVPGCGHTVTRRAKKVGGTFQAMGYVLSLFHTTYGEARYVFELDDPKGVLRTYSPVEIEFIK